MKLQRIALFISGKGSNARNIMQYFQNHKDICVSLVLSSVPNPEMKKFCEEQQIAFKSLEKVAVESYLQDCLENMVDWVILAGFLKKIPVSMIHAFPNRMLNIHPSLLPNFGGKGMYGSFVHHAVSKAHMSFSGITIHLVNEEFDKGKILAQFGVSLVPPVTPESIEHQVRELEMSYFPEVIERVIRTSFIE